jgi:hypothetical protein
MKLMRLTILLFIIFNINIYCQDTLVMPLTGNGGIYNSCYAIIYDNGGADSNYHNFSNSTITIAPLWVQHVDLYFEMFDTEDFFDSLTIYDGPSTTFPLIGTFSGNSLQGQTVSSTGNSITLKFRSDDIQTGAGFKATVSCLMGNEEETLKELVVYPNPAQKDLTLNGIEFQNIRSMSITDITGRSVSAVNSIYINIEDLSPGIYYLLMEDKNGRKYSTRFIKE